MMILLFLILIFAAILLIIFAFAPSHKVSPQMPNGQPERQLNPPFEEEADSLKNELVRLRKEYQSSEAELTLYKDKEAQLQKELGKFEGGDNQANVKLKNELLAKEKEIEQAFAMNLNLNKELKEHKDKIALLEKEKKEMLNELRMFEAKNTGFKKEAED